jgi:hypothetical protein
MFERFLMLSPTVRKVELSNYGEAFLNRGLGRILEIAFARGITISIANGANLNRLADGLADLLVRTRVSTITCSIDGATQETYARYRVKGDLARVLCNVDAINDAKQRYKSDCPDLVWQFVVFGHNEHEIPQARAMAKARGMRFKPKISWDDKISPVHDEVTVRRETGLPGSRAEFREETGQPYNSQICRQLWVDPQFNWNGDNLGCCRNFWGDFGGNVLNDGLEATFNGEKMRRARRMLMGAEAPSGDVPCATCDLFLEMQKTGTYLTRAQVLGRSNPHP